MVALLRERELDAWQHHSLVAHARAQPLLLSSSALVQSGAQTLPLPVPWRALAPAGSISIDTGQRNTHSTAR
jgi:hypothetical protein